MDPCQAGWSARYTSIISTSPLVTVESSVSGPATAARAASRGLEPFGNEPPSGDEHPRRGHLAQPGRLEATDGLTEPHQLRRPVVVDAGLVGDDLLFDICGREAELDGDHALARRVLEVLEHALVPGVVGHDQAEPGRGVEGHPEPVDRELAAMVGQWMQHDRRVLAGLDDFVEVADGALAHGPRQRAIDPLRFTAAQQEPSHEIRGRQVVMAGDGDERPVEVVGHRLEEARLAAPRRSLEQRPTCPVGRPP